MKATEFPNEITQAAFRENELLARVERLTAENERLRAALRSCQSWIDRWTLHVGNCKGDAQCTCGRSAILFDADNALNQQTTNTTDDKTNG